MAFSSGEVLTAANLNDLDIDSITVDTSTLVVDKTNNKVGIGTTTPSESLDVVTSSGSAYVRSHNGTTTSYIGSDSSNTGLFGTSTAHRVRFITNDTERMTILSGGQVGIGVDDPLRSLDIKNDMIIFHSDEDHAWLSETDTSGVYKMWYQNTYSSGDSGWNNYLQIVGASSGLLKVPRAYTATTGNSANLWVDTDGGFYKSTSSAKYKTDVETMEDEYADAILGLRPVWYRSIATADRRDWSHWGFIAEEVAAIDPRLVHYGPEQETDDDGNLIFEDGSPLWKKDSDGKVIEAPEGVQYDRLVPHLLNIIKRQEARITALENA